MDRHGTWVTLAQHHASYRRSRWPVSAAAAPCLRRPQRRSPPSAPAQRTPHLIVISAQSRCDPGVISRTRRQRSTSLSTSSARCRSLVVSSFLRSAAALSLRSRTYEFKQLGTSTVSHSRRSVGAYNLAAISRDLTASAAILNSRAAPPAGSARLLARLPLMKSKRSGGCGPRASAVATCERSRRDQGEIAPRLHAERSWRAESSHAENARSTCATSSAVTSRC